MANARIASIRLNEFADDDSVEPESFYRYFYPHEVDLVLPISCSNDLYHIQPSHATTEAFDGLCDLQDFIENTLSGTSSHSEEMPFSDEFLVGSDIDTITNCRLLNKFHSRAKRILLLDLGKYVLMPDDDHETMDWKRARRLEFIRGYVKEVKRKRFARQYKRYVSVRDMLLPSVAAEAAQLRDLEIADAGLDREYFYSPDEQPDMTDLLRIRREAIERKYEKYATCAAFRRQYHNRIYHNINAKVPANELQRSAANSSRRDDTLNLSAADPNDSLLPRGNIPEVCTVEGTPHAPRYHSPAHGRASRGMPPTPPPRTVSLAKPWQASQQEQPKKFSPSKPPRPSDTVPTNQSQMQRRTQPLEVIDTTQMQLPGEEDLLDEVELLMNDISPQDISKYATSLWASARDISMSQLQTPVMQHRTRPFEVFEKPQMLLPGEDELMEEVERMMDDMPEQDISEYASSLRATQRPVHDPKNKSMRFNRFMELCGTESNYVGILHTILTVFQKPLEAMAGQPNGLLNKAEVRAIFNNFSPIYDVHRHMLDRLTELQSNWSENSLIGQIILDHSDALLAAYPPYVNFFDQMRDALVKCASQNPRFQEFLTTNQAKRECGRQTLQELMIRPVQRLPSISLLLADLLKNTPKSSPDHALLAQALESIKDVMSHINEDKRRMEGLLSMFDLFNEIAGCPADLVASQRRLVSRCEVIELSDTLSGRGTTLMLYLFDDCLEVCKMMRKSTFTSVRSQQVKKFKHVRLVRLQEIKMVCDIEDGERAFGLELENGEKLAFRIAVGGPIKIDYMRELCKLLAEISGTKDASIFMRIVTFSELGITAKDFTKSRLDQLLRTAQRSGLKSLKIVESYTSSIRRSSAAVRKTGGPDDNRRTVTA